MQTHKLSTTPNLKELTKHGSHAFPLAIYKTTLNKNKLGYVQMHWHDKIQFVYVLNGCVKFEIEQYVYYIEEGNGIFINSGCLHSATTHDSEDSTYICIDIGQNLYLPNSKNIVSEKYLTPFLDINHVKTISLNSDIPWQKDILAKIISLSQINDEKNFAYELLIQIKIIEILYTLISNSKELLLNENIYLYNENQRIKEVLTYIQDNYTNKINLDDLASQANLCKSEFCRFFKKMTNQTPFEYLVNYRISQSAYLLRNSDYSILEISNKVGFNSVSYFVKRFKEQTSCTPKYYRNFHADTISK